MKIAHRLAHVKPSLTLAVTAKAAELKAQGHDIISFGAGEPDFNTPQPIIDAAKKALDEGKTKWRLGMEHFFIQGEDFDQG